MSMRSGDMTSPGAISPSTPVLFDSPRLGSEERPSPRQLDARFSTSWAEQPPSLASAVSGPLAHFQFGQQGFDGTPLPTSIEQGLGLRSLSAFAFHSTPVSQPVSFMRHSVDGSHGHSDPSIIHTQDKGYLSHALHEEDESHLNSKSVSNEDGTHHGLEDTDALHSLLFDAHQVSLEGNGTSPPSRLGGTPAAMESAEGYSIGLPRDHQMLPDSMQENAQPPQEFSLAENKWQTYLSNVTDNYGLDSGRPDQDLSFNNDHAAIDINYALDLISSREKNQDVPQSTSQHVPEAQAQFCSGYYASPVPINIPRYLSPLPSSLLGNPINLMYFHHFLNHTARMLVPHNCDNNPFVSVLPSSKPCSRETRVVVSLPILTEKWPLVIRIS